MHKLALKNINFFHWLCDRDKEQADPDSVLTWCAAHVIVLSCIPPVADIAVFAAEAALGSVAQLCSEAEWGEGRVG